MIIKKDSNDILYLHDYYPADRRDEEVHRGISEEIIEFKNGKRSAINRFAAEIICGLHWLGYGHLEETEQYCVAIVPSHKASEWGDSLVKVAEILCEVFNMEDKSRVLIRTQNRKKLAYGGDRSIESHLQTICVDIFDDVMDKNFIILDDVTTTGGSMKACIAKLKEAGAREVQGVVIGKSVPKKFYDAFSDPFQIFVRLIRKYEPYTLFWNILFGLVRSQRISGFLKDANRLNVVLSRAQELCAVISDTKLAKQSKSGLLGELYQYLAVNESIYNENLCMK